MRFLAMSTAQVLALIAATTGLVLVLFFLRLRHRRFLVGSSMLWDRVLDRRHANSLAEKLRRLLSLALTLAIALLIAFALGKPSTQTEDAAPRTRLIVLDTSPTMGARTTEGTTRWAAADRRARDLLSGVAPEGGFMITDTAGRVQTLLTREVDVVTSALDRMGPIPGPQRFPSLPGGERDVYFITDGVSTLEIPEGVTEVFAFEPADNVAITAFEVRVDPTSPSGYRAFLEVANFGTQSAEVGVLLSGAGSGREAWRVDLAPGQEWRDDLDLSGFQGGGLRLRIEAEGDGLGLDDTAYAYLPPANSLRVDLVTPAGGSYLETLLRLSPRVDLRVVSPEDYTEDPAVDVYVFSGFFPTSPPREPTLVFGTDDVSWLPPPGGRAQDPRVTDWEADHPVMQHVPLYDVAIGETARLEPGDWRVVAASDETPLILIDETPVRRVLVGFALDGSDFPLQLGFPIFVENALAWCSGEGLAQPAALGPIRIPGEAQAVTTLDGSDVPTTEEFGARVIEAAAPELFTAIVEGRRVRVAANLLDRAVSDVNRTRGAGDIPDMGTPAGPSALWSWMLLTASLLIVLEWWTWHRRITV